MGDVKPQDYIQEKPSRSQRENERSHYLWEGEWGEQMRTLHGLSTSSGPCVFEPVLTCMKEK